MVAEEILPTLLIRQSALYLFGEGRQETLYEQAVPGSAPKPVEEDLRAALVQSGRYLPSGPGDPALSWVRLVIPLLLQGRTLGVWLIGRRDPDDYFPASDIHLLSTVANQIAPMAENVRLYEKAQQEIAQRKAAEEEIRRSEERFRTLFEATLEGIAIVRNGVILEVNHALLAIFGAAPDEILGRRLADLATGEVDLAGVPRESIGFKQDGSTVDIEIAGKRYVFQGEEVSVVAIRDIAQRKRDEAENKMLQRQLLHSQKMEAIGRLSAGVAHDFNNCLLAIFGYSDLLLERYQADPFLARNLTGLKEAGQRAAALTKQLLAFARRQPMETKVMNLNSVVSGLEKMLQRLLGEDIHMSSALHPELGKVKIDSGQIEQVIVNLAVNARHAMPSGGRLSLRTVPVDVAPGRPAPHDDVPPGTYVLLTVTDTGQGMDAATQARVFEPFFSTKGEGTGLGLSTAYGIVRQSGGHIFVNSAPGQGACFSVYLPVTQEAEAVRGAVAPGISDRGLGDDPAGRGRGRGAGGAPPDPGQPRLPGAPGGVRRGGAGHLAAPPRRHPPAADRRHHARDEGDGARPAAARRAPADADRLHVRLQRRAALGWRGGLPPLPAEALLSEDAGRDPAHDSRSGRRRAAGDWLRTRTNTDNHGRTGTKRRYRPSGSFLVSLWVRVRPCLSVGPCRPSRGESRLSNPV